MQLKDVILYILCVPASIWAVYEGSKVPGYIGLLKKDSPECYQPNPNRWELFIGTQVILAMVSIPL